MGHVYLSHSDVLNGVVALRTNTVSISKTELQTQIHMSRGGYREILDETSVYV